MILRPGRIPSFLPEIHTFRNNVAVGAGSNDLLSNETCAALDRFVRDCYNAGVWGKLYEVYPFVGNNLLAASIKLKTVGSIFLTAVNFVSADYTERDPNGGLAGDGATKYINTNASLNAVIGTIGHMSAYIREVETTTPRYWMGGGTASDFYLLGQAASNPNCYWGGTAQLATDISPATIGLYQVERSANNLMELFLNGTLRSNNTNAVVPVAGGQNVYLYCRNANGSAVNFTAKRFSFFSIGLPMSATERAAFYNAVQNLQINLQRNV